jgi:hypothetical protein
MMHDSMEFYELYRSRLIEDGGAEGVRRGRPLARPRRRGRPLPRLCGRVLLASGHLLVTAGARLAGGSVGAANSRVRAHG